MALLEVKNLGISFGGLRAVDGFNITIEKGQLYGLIGPNGAGKTTCFNMLTGVYTPTDGTITLNRSYSSGKKTVEELKRELPERSRISGFSKSSLFWIMSK